MPRLSKQILTIENTLDATITKEDCMGFRTLRQCVETLRGEGEVIEIDYPIDPHLEIAEIQRRLFRAGGPALLFTSALGT